MKITHSRTVILLILFLFLVVGLLSQTGPVLAVSPDIVISQVYGGGGNGGAPYTNDFIELFNRGASAVNVSGWAVQYASATGSSWSITAINGTIQPGQYYLVQEGSGGTNGIALPTPDATGSLSMSASNGKVALTNSTAGLTSATPTDASIVDFVGYGTATFFEGSAAAPGLSNTTSDSRAENGCQDTDNNSVDFTAGTVSPRNSTSPLNPCGSPPTVPEVLLTEVVVTPTAGEFIEIFNPTNSTIDLSDYYLTDATFAGGGTYYYNIVSGLNAGGGGFGDFNARFPDGATISTGEYQTIALSGSDGFFAEYGINPTYELFEDGLAEDSIPNMREALPGSINGQGGLSNDGEIVILYYWDGATDLVTDMDYLVWGDKAEAVDKTGVSIDGPDADANTSSYLPDTAILSQDVIASGEHALGNSWQRDDLTEGTEITSGGNGLNGDDETSENLSITWCENDPTPGVASVCPLPASLMITEIMYDPNSSEDNWEWVEIYNPGGSPIDLTGYVFDDNNSVAHSSANIAGGVIAAGQSAILFNVDDVSAADFSAAWGNVNLIPVTDWSAGGLNNSGDTVGLWASFADYSGDNTTHANTVDSVDYSASGFPDPVGASIFFTVLTADNDNGTNWSISTNGGATPLYNGYTSAAAGGNVGTDIGSPGIPSSLLIINEILADPASGSPGDANGDGTRDATQDEFVEIFNDSSSDVNISGWTLSDSNSVRHTFPANTVVRSQCSIVVFGGNSPTGTFGYSLVQTASSGGLGLNNTGDTVTLSYGSLEVASYSYFGEGGDDQSLTRDPDVTGPEPLIKHSLATGSGGTLFSPGTLADGSQFDGCPKERKIHEVQGNGLTSPLVGDAVVIEGIIVGDYQDGTNGVNGDLNGFFIQEEDADADADPQTSEGIFVYDGSNPTVNVAIGDLVEVIGAVSEFDELTEITSFSGVTVMGSNYSLPTPASITLPVSAIEDFEAFEGMGVVFPQALSISEYFNFDRFGEVVLSNGRPYQPTAIFDPGSPAASNLALANTLNRITLDDGRSAQNPDPALHPAGGIFDIGHLFRGGDQLENLTGVLSEGFDLYRIQPTDGATFIQQNPRQLTHDPVGGTIEVASFNVLNYFTTFDTNAGSGNGPDICGPNQNLECRGANDAIEFGRQKAKVIAAILDVNADIVGLNEIENNPNDDSVEDLVAGLNAAAGTGTYDYVETGPVGTDAIKVALLYKPATVELVGNYAILDSSVDPRFIDTKSRPVIVQTFLDKATGGVVTVALNHLKSKGSPCDDVGDYDTGDGADSCNLTRKAAAEALVDWLATDPTGSGDGDFLIIGDLNSYDKEDPIDAILAGSDDTVGSSDDYTDLDFAFNGEYAYSYVFDGQLGYLDYALSNANLTPQVTGTTVWHINADEPDILDYDMSFKLDAQDALYESNAFRASDHDPVIVGLDLNGSPVCSAAAATPDTLWPANHNFVQIGILGVSDPEGDPITITIDSIFQDEEVLGRGRGKTSPDGQGVGTDTAEVRAERSGNENGRVYHIYFTAADDNNNSCSGEVLVGVPLNQGNGSTAIDDGPNYDSTAP